MKNSNYSLYKSVTTKSNEICYFQKRAPLVRKSIPFVSRDDAKILAVTLAARVGLSTKALTTLCDGMPVRAKHRARKRFMSGMHRYFPDMDLESVQAIVDRYERAKPRQVLSYTLAERDTWRPRLDLEGKDALDAALAKGRGVILWADNFLSHAVAGKRTLHQHGVVFSAISVSTHGFPETQLAQRFRHHRQVGVENRYLETRIVFDRLGTEPVKDRVFEKLRHNQIVMITNNTFAGFRFIDIPMRDGLRYKIAHGPIELAMKTGAALLPVATIESVPLERYATFIGPELNRPNGLHSEDIACETAMNYREWIVPLIQAHPEQWKQWSHILEEGDDNVVVDDG